MTRQIITKLRKCTSCGWVGSYSTVRGIAGFEFCPSCNHRYVGYIPTYYHTTEAVFDSVNVPCPKCGNRQEVQSRGGAGIGVNHDMESCPDNILIGVNHHALLICTHCSTVFELKLTVTAESIFSR